MSRVSDRIAKIEQTLRERRRLIVELIAFLLMLAMLARYVYPRIITLAEARQRAIAQQLKEAREGAESSSNAGEGGGS